MPHFFLLLALLLVVALSAAARDMDRVVGDEFSACGPPTRSMLLLARLLDDEKHCSCCSITVTGGLPVGAGGCCRCDLLVCCLWREIIVVLVWILVLRVLVSSWSKVLYYVAYSSMRVNVIRATGTCLIGLNGLIFLFYGICLCKYNIPHPPVLVFRCSVLVTPIFPTKKR